jgi:hypothetical protein
MGAPYRLEQKTQGAPGWQRPYINFGADAAG